MRLRALSDRPWEELDTGFVEDLVALPDQGFLEAVEAVIPLADGLTLTEDGLPLEILVRLREVFCTRLKRCHIWRWQKDEVSDTLARDVAGAVQALFVHSPYAFVRADCRLPASAAAFSAIFPALADLALDAPGLSFVATLMMNDFERGAAWAAPALLVEVAEAWMKVRGSDTTFWRDHGFGPRLCAWFSGRAERGTLGSGEVVARVQALADRLAEIGVPEALTLESALSAV